jgi:hypothetical protein
MAAFKIKFKPNRRVINNFIKCFGQDPITINKVMKKSKVSIAKYWYNNVYEYFDARKSNSLPVTGQLGRSLRVENDGKTKLTLTMIEMHNDRTKYFVFDFPRMPTMSGAMNFTPFSMPGLGMGREMDLDYGKLLREGFGPSNKGYYDFTKDCKVMPNGGRHPGYNRLTRWVPWMNDFLPMSRQILAEYMLRELKKIGVNGNIPQWRVDINI